MWAGVALSYTVQQQHASGQGGTSKLDRKTKLNVLNQLKAELAESEAKTSLLRSLVQRWEIWAHFDEQLSGMAALATSSTRAAENGHSPDPETASIRNAVL